MAAHNHVMKKFGKEQKNLSDIKHIAGKGDMGDDAKILLKRK